jgi:hypothetical protein
MVKQASHTSIEAHARMKWFRSNIRPGSRLALVALAIQFLLSFGHFHGSRAQAASALLDVKQTGLHDTARFAAMQSYALDSASHDASRPAHEPGGQPTADCAICAVMAQANAMVVAAPVCLPAPQAFALLYSTADAEFVDLNSVRVPFQPRAPPIS